MATLKKAASAHPRSGPAAPFDGSATGSDLRPYLVTPGRRYPALFPHESEDARITGETRSLFRRLLALNLPRTSTTMADSRPGFELEPRPVAQVAAMTGIKIA